jgi:hypothetical protein
LISILLVSLLVVLMMFGFLVGRHLVLIDWLLLIYLLVVWLMRRILVSRHLFLVIVYKILSVYWLSDFNRIIFNWLLLFSFFFSFQFFLVDKLRHGVFCPFLLLR